MKLEFLVLIKNDDSFCNSKRAFVDFLKVDSSISITGQKLTFRKSQKSKPLITINFRVETNTIPSNAERYFLIVLESKDDSLIDEFSDVGNKIKEICKRINPTSIVINVLWDDIGRYYACQAYPFINDVENVMRKLISKFMLINVGMEWSKETILPELERKIKDYDEDDFYLNDLYKLDFINLSDMLFKKKRDTLLEDLDRVLSKTEFGEEDKGKILKFLPRSNWEKFFSTIIGVNAQSLEEKWRLLYKLRNKVAHNRSLTKDDFEKIKGLTNSVNKILKEAVDKLGEIDLDEEERETIIGYYQSESFQYYDVIIKNAIIEYFFKTGFSVVTLDVINSGSKVDFIVNDSNKDIAVNVYSIALPGRPGLLRLKIERAISVIEDIMKIENISYGEVFFVVRTLATIEDIRYFIFKQPNIEGIIDKNQNVKIRFGIINTNSQFEIIEI